MTTKIYYLLSIALLGCLPVLAQQNPQPLTLPPLAVSAQPDCAPATAQPPNTLTQGIHFHIPSALQKKIETSTGIQIPNLTPQDLAKRPQKPCRPAPAIPASPAIAAQPDPQASATALYNIILQAQKPTTTAPLASPATVPNQPEIDPAALEYIIAHLQRPCTAAPAIPITTTTPKK
jgi:hypothetical protein